MASIVDMCWTNAEELFSGLNLDDLYMRQISVIGGTRRSGYPYVLLINTGKITIGISLGGGTDSLEDQARLLLDDDGRQYDELTLWKLLRESSE
ncbi:MAG: hypothetical protein HY912_06300 [Desulfomonile tiedjei]|uniref:Uncharacterized protein n=1 Tax=Desulfomonile tiedjei TaxID=2358 RepID=A0A9D6Z2Z8_9BACT|nr:hypothetical protein [Desulfomonile tiedjei]